MELNLEARLMARAVEREIDLRRARRMAQLGPLPLRPKSAVPRLRRFAAVPRTLIGALRIRWTPRPGVQG